MVWPSDSSVAVVVLLVLTLAIWPAAGVVAMSRLRRLSAVSDWPGEGDSPATPSAAVAGAGTADADRSGGSAAVRRRAQLFAGLVGAAVLATFPSLFGGLAAVTVSAGSYLLLRRTAPTDATRSGRGAWMTAIRWPAGRAGRLAGADPTLPFAIDLLAVCLRAGMATSAALRSVASILSVAGGRGRAAASAFEVPGVSEVLARVAAASELGAEPATAWELWIGHPVYGPLARALVVTGESGSAVAGRLEAVSHQLRTAAGQQAMARAQRAGVALMAPLGLCFLPAFVCLGVVPVVVGIAGRVFG